jgi:hypothetical protein
MEKQPHADKYIFWVCLIAAIAIGAISFILPPRGVIDPSCLKFIALLLGFSALGIAGQNLANGKEVSFKKDDLNVTIGDNDDEDK